ncbi:MAG: TonB-dependent receptor [Rikenellaceae bacterium]
MRQKLYFCVLSMIICFGFAFAANAQTVTGTVTDGQTKQAIAGVVVLKQGTTEGAITDDAGKYSIDKMEVGTVLEYSFIGYETQAAIYSGQSVINVEMKNDGVQVDEVVVVGFGTQKKVNLTGSVAVVDKKALDSRPVSNAADMLQGAVPGLNITNSGGTELGGSASIDIRGTGTIGSGSSGDPLILIDGMEGDFNSLNPQDIESVSVLKDAASSAIYGSRAPFGVILITTKKGTDRKTSVSYNNSFRLSTPRNLPEMMDSWTFANYMNEADANAGTSSGLFPQSRIDDIKRYQNGELDYNAYTAPTDDNFWGDGFAYGIGDTDHYDNAYKDWAFSQEHNLSVTGGSDKVNFYLSANYSNTSGFFETNPDKIDRLTSTAKINAKLYDWLTVTYTTRFSDRNYDYPTAISETNYSWGGGLKFYTGLSQWPTCQDYDSNGNPYSSLPRDNGSAVFSLTNMGDSNQRDKNYYQQVQFVLEPIKDWKTFIDYNYRHGNTERTAATQKSYNVGVDNQTLYPVSVDSSVEEYRYSLDYTNFNAYSEYTKTYRDIHNFKAMVGFQTESNNNGNVTLLRDGLIVSNLVSIDTTNGLSSTGSAVAPTVSGAYYDWVTAGFFGRLNYDYDGRYLVEASLRYDGTSRFIGDNRWGLFPSGSVGWNVANEDFFEPIKESIDVLKVRASYGQLGNQNTTSLYPTYRTMSISTSAGDYLIGGVQPTYTSEPTLIDPDLTWERIINWNIGIDLQAFDHRLNLTADYFVRDTKDMVGPAPDMPEYFGFTVPKQNNTDLSTKGWEISLSWRDNLESGFAYGASFSLSDAITTITSYPNDNMLLSDYYSGQTMGEIWGYETIGIAKTQEEMDAHLATTTQSSLGGNWAAGDIMYKDLNGDGIINSGSNSLSDHGDLKIIGNNTPRYAISFSANASYKGFDVSAFFQGVMKRDYWAGGDLSTSGSGRYFWGVYGNIWNATALTQHIDYFRGNEDNVLGLNIDSYYPRPLFGNTYKNMQVQTRYLQDASYLRLKNVQIGYSLPQRVLDKIGFSKLRIFASGENLLTFTSLPDIYDPETISGGYYGSAYPQAATISFGLNVTF